jgi:ABC-type spermidine/putrescine transport system permease subunit I
VSSIALALSLCHYARKHKALSRHRTHVVAFVVVSVLVSVLIRVYGHFFDIKLVVSMDYENALDWLSTCFAMGLLVW